ncbi:MAG: Flp pilus assembly complex ATPase component TadA [Actinomycetota bacterium]|nr:Flp pilus assembly complex ATPase component TadA [Actinomycetota bacterium]
MAQTTPLGIDTPAPAAAAPARTRPGPLIGEIIVELGFATAEQVDGAVEVARRTLRPTGKVLVADGIIKPDQLAQAVARRFGMDHVDPSTYPVDMAAANLVTPAAAKRLNAVPIGFLDKSTLLVATADPANVLAVDDIAMLTGYGIRPAVAAEEDIAALITRLNRLGDAVQEVVEEEDEPVPTEITDLRDSAEDAPIIKLVHSLIAQAVDQGASDIHFEPDEGELQVRFRVDGVLVDTANVPKRISAGVVSRLKVMADLDIAQRRMPQDGRMSLSVDDRQVDLRVVTLPLVHGESVVLRILDQGTVPMGLHELGLRDDERARVEASLRLSHGAVLATGPTGSGKSTSLYAALMGIRTREKSILTIEDPVEYQVSGIKQVQVNERAGLTFATGLRSMMRADPDVIMVGEIRDRESALIGIEAALTGHLVLSSLHTNDAPSAVTRLIEMGIEPFLVASSIECVIAQRLARRLCRSCRQPTKLPAAVFGPGGDGEIDVYEPAGCSHCAGTGYKGRIGLFEVMTLTEELRTLVVERASADQIARLAVTQGMRRLRDDGLAKVRAGETSVAEVARVTGS